MRSSAASRLVTVHSDVGGGEVDSVETDADSTPQIHLTPYGRGLRAEPLVAPFSIEGPAFRPGKGGRVVFAIVGGQRLRTHRDFEDGDPALRCCQVLLPGTEQGELGRHGVDC